MTAGSSESKDSDNQIASQHQQSFFAEVDEFSDLPPEQLSGDQSAEKSLLLSDVSAGKSNFLLTVTTIMKTVIGAGILAIPFTMNKLGLILSIIIFFLVICANQFTCVSLLRSKNLSRHSNYSSIMYHLMHHKALQALCSIAILLNNIGICIAELTIFKSTIKKLFQEFTENTSQEFYTSGTFIILILALIQIPFTLVKKITKLKFMAFTGVAGIFIFIITHTFFFFTATDRLQQINLLPKDFIDVVSVVPTLMLAFSFQMNFFPVFKGLKNSCDRKMSKASLVGLCCCGFFYFTVGIMGVLLFQNNLKANYLLNLKKQKVKNDALVLIINSSFLTSVFFSFPVMFFGARNNFIALMKLIFLRKQNDQIRSQYADHVDQISSYMVAQNQSEAKKKANILFYIYTALLFGVAIGIAIAVDDVEIVFGIVGAIASNAIGFIFPCFFYMMLVLKKRKQKGRMYYIAVALFFILIPFGLSAVGILIYNAIQQ